MVIRISRDGQTRADVVSELFKYLRYRYELSERALVHHAKLAADVMIGKAMEMWKAALVADFDAQDATGEEEATENVKATNEEKATKLIEQQALRRGDDGLLEHMLDETEQRGDDERWKGISEIVTQIQGRKLFKPIGVYTGRAMAKDLYGLYRKADERTKVEQEAARRAGAEHDWMVALWVPNPKMRLKAEVLVDDGSQLEIVPLRAWDRENGQRGSEIIESHYGLWAMRVYVDRRLLKKQREMVLDSLREQLGIKEWDRRDGTPAEIAAGGATQDEQWSDVVEAERLDAAAMPLAGRQTPDGLERLPADTGISAAMGRLLQWRANGRISIEHPDLEELIAAAEDSVVPLDNEEFDLKMENAIAQLNLTLFLRELSDNVYESPDGRNRVVQYIEDSPTDLEDRVLSKRATSDAARRIGENIGETNRAAQAFELAVSDFLRTDRGGRLL